MLHVKSLNVSVYIYSSLYLPTIALISHATKLMLKTLQARLQQYLNNNFHMFNLELEKAKEP